VTHTPTGSVYGQASDVTMREPDTPREGEAVTIWARVGYSFYWTNAAVYYTTNGTEPQGSHGTATNGTAVAMAWSHNEPYSPSNIDWIKAAIPTQAYGTTVKYKIGVWNSGGGIEVFANNTGCADNTCDNSANPATVFQYNVKLAWPGRGYGNTSPGEGFPNIHFWKEEAVVGNNYTNVQIDQNGTMYDMYFPSVGGTWGVGTKNEGYVDGDDTFPPGLPLGSRGQMHMNQAQAGLRVDGVTYWLSNEGGAFSNHTQAYVTDTNVVHTASRLTISGNSILVDQYDFCPKGITFPKDNGGQPVPAVYVKRYLLTNNGTAAKTVDFYYNANFALNGGDSYDGIFADMTRGAMVAYDNTARNTSSSGEYNPLSYGDYPKNVSVYLGASLKLCTGVGSSAGVPASDGWRDSSPDNDASWIGVRVPLAAGETRELDVAMVGAFENTAGQSGTYTYFIAPALDWFLSTSMASIQDTTEAYWSHWLDNGVVMDSPDDDYDAMFKRALLATALHCDAKGGGVIAGMHNGAYPFIWPRDALYAAITLDRTGHTFEAGEVYRYLRDVAYRASDTWGKGFWYQKYTTDGYIVWNSPQVDETANVPWGGYYHYLTTGNLSFLNDYYTMFYEAARAMSEDSSIDGRLRYEDTYKLMYSNNVWEDSWDTFIYSNAAVERGLRDAAAIATATGHTSDAATFTGRADSIHDGLNGRLDWNGENTDISQLGIVYPFETHEPTDARAARVVDRMNGVATDAWGNNHPIINFSGEWQDLVNRYWNDTYWWNTSNPNQHGSPWFLTTMWYGQYYACRQDYNPGKADIDNFKYRIDHTKAFLGPAGMGAEQMCPSVSQMYAGFTLETAWPNAWESMSTLADCLMMFLDYTPDAPNSRIYLAPKLPTTWSTLTYTNIQVVPGRAINVTCNELAAIHSQSIKNRNGGTVNYDTYIRIPSGTVIAAVKQDGTPVSYTFDATASRVHVIGTINTAAGSTTTIAVITQVPGDFDTDGDVDDDDVDAFAACATGPHLGPRTAACASVDFDQDMDVDMADFGVFQRCVSIGAASADPNCAN
jgi:GH15 family glucan-1,4-alpha-glucosidase